jgi:hypothetical protein
MELQIDFSDPLMRSLLLPFLATLASCGIFRLFAGPWRGRVHGGLGIGLGFLAFILLRYGFVGWPVSDAVHILGLVVVGAMATGAIMDELELPDSAITFIHVALPFALVFGLGNEFEGEKLTTSVAIIYGALTVGGFWVLQRLEQDRDEGLAPHLGAVMGLGALALAGVVRDNSLNEPAAALGAAILAFGLINWPHQRLSWGAGTGFISGLGFLAVATLMIFSDPALKVPVALSFLAFIASPAAQKYFPTKPALEPFVQIFFGLAAVLLSGVAAYLI